jgi:hypothetical protein
MDKNDIIKLKKIINNIKDIDIIDDIINNLKKKKDINKILKRFKYGEHIIKLISNIDNNRLVIQLFDDRKYILDIGKNNKLSTNLTNQKNSTNNNLMINNIKELLIKLKDKKNLDNLIFRIEKGEVDIVLDKLNNKNKTKITKNIILKYITKLKDINVINKLLNIIDENKDNGKLDEIVEQFSPFTELFDMFGKIINMIPKAFELIMVLITDIIPKLVQMLPTILEWFLYSLTVIPKMIFNIQLKIFSFKLECMRVPIGMATIGLGLFIGLQIALSSLFGVDGVIPPLLVIAPLTLFILFMIATDDLYLSLDDNGNSIPSKFPVAKKLYEIAGKFGMTNIGKRRFSDEVQDKVLEFIEYLLCDSFIKDICQKLLDYDDSMFNKKDPVKTVKNIMEWISSKFVRIIFGMVLLGIFFKIFFTKVYGYATKYIIDPKEAFDSASGQANQMKNIFNKVKSFKK